MAWVAVARGTEASPPTASQTISSLTGNTLYRVRVRAKNSSGAGSWAFGTGGTTTSAVPAAPTDMEAGTGDTELFLIWTPPSGTLTGYDVHYTSAPASGNGSVANSVTSTGSNPATGWVAVSRGVESSPPENSQYIRNLDNGTTYRGRVRAKNTNGAGSWGFISGTPVVAIPLEVINLAVIAGDTQLSLSWDRNSGGGAPASYRVHYTTSTSVAYSAAVGSDVATGWVDTGYTGATTSYTITGLTNNQAYRVRVLAKNASAESDWEEVSGTPSAPPAAPTNLTTTAGHTVLVLTWTAPSGTLTGYDVHYTSATTSSVNNDAAASGNNAATAWVAVSRGSEASPPTASQTISSLNNGTLYRLRVRGKNGSSDGAWVFGMGTPDVLASPSSLLVIPRNTGLRVSWSTVSAATGYDVQYTSANTATTTGNDPATAWVAVTRTGTPTI